MRLIPRSRVSSPVAGWLRTGVVRSVQTGTIELNGVASATATIAEVDLAHALVIYHGLKSASVTNNAGRIWARLALTNGTTVTAARGGTEAVACLVYFTVIEFYPGALKSVQRGTINVNGGTSATATINAVDPSKSWVEHLGSTHNDDVETTARGERMVALALTNGTTVTATIAVDPTISLVTGYQVAEWW